MKTESITLETNEAYRYLEDNEMLRSRGIGIKRLSGGFNLYSKFTGRKIARLVPVENAGHVKVLYWGHRDKWEAIGDFGGVVLPINEALNYIESDQLGIFS